MNLSDKITSCDEFRRVSSPPQARAWMQESHSATIYCGGMCWINAKPSLDGDGVTHMTFEASSRQVPNHVWWYAREMYRAQMGVYSPPTKIIENLRSNLFIGQLCLHISKDDPTMVAYTATPEDGARDKQTRTTLGRFIRRFFPLMTDAYVAELEASHRSELNPDVKFHSFITEFGDARAAYTAIQACMSKADEAYISKMSPLRAYMAPGFSLAVLYKSGKPAARNIVWVNPNDPKDKRMVRTYGDAMLEKNLKMQGFKYVSFEGAYLKAEAFMGDAGNGVKKRLLNCPYVDAVAGTGAGNTFGVWDGQDKLYIVDTVIGSHLKAVSIRSASGCVDAKSNIIDTVCCITGDAINPFDSKSLGTVWVDGKLGVAKSSAVKGWKSVIYVGKDTPNVAVLAPQNTPSFLHGGSHCLDTLEAREKLGYARLSHELYPDITTDNGWAFGLVSTADGGIMPADAVNLVGQDKQIAKVHKSRVPDSAVRCASISDVKTYALAGVETVVIQSGRRVIPDVHEVVQLWSGEWVYRRHSSTLYVMGALVYGPARASEFSPRASAILPPMQRHLVACAEETLGAVQMSAAYPEVLGRICLSMLSRGISRMYISGISNESRNAGAATKLGEWILGKPHADDAEVSAEVREVREYVMHHGRLVHDWLTAYMDETDRSRSNLSHPTTFLASWPHPRSASAILEVAPQAAAIDEVTAATT